MVTKPLKLCCSPIGYNQDTLDITEDAVCVLNYGDSDITTNFAMGSPDMAYITIANDCVLLEDVTAPLQHLNLLITCFYVVLSLGVIRDGLSIWSIVVWYHMIHTVSVAS